MSSPPPDDVREELPEERIKRVLDVAAELAIEGGLDAVRMREIATRAGIALGTLYKYYGSKDEVLVALLEREVDLLEQSMGWLRVGGDTYVKRAMAFFEPVTRILHTRGSFSRALLIAVATSSPELAARVTRYHQRTTDLIASALRGAEPPRAEVRALEPDELTRVAYMLSQIWFAALIGSLAGQFSADTSVAHVEAAAAWLVRGALASPGP